MLTPVENPTAYGLVETDADGNILRFLEKPNADEITCDTINAGHLRARAGHLRPHPERHAVVDRAQLFPSLIERGETFVAYVDRGYWIDIGTPEKYLQVHRDIMDGRYKAPPFAATPGTACVSPEAKIEEGAIDRGALLHRRRRRRQGRRAHRPYSVIGRQCHIEEHAQIDDAVVWANCRISQEAIVRHSIVGRHCHIGRSALVEDGAVLGDKSVVTDYSRL